MKQEAMTGTLETGLSILLDGKSHIVYVDAKAVPGFLCVTVDGVEHRFPVMSRRSHRGKSQQDNAHAHITSPMPGKIVRVLVQVGDEVQTGQGLVVVEAMKMENELLCKKAGKVAAIHVTAGETVASGAILMVLA